MKKHGTKITALFLCLVLLCSSFTACGQKAASTETESGSAEEDLGPEVYVFPQTTAVAFEEMDGDTYDETAAQEALDQIVKLCSQPHALKEIKAAYDVLISQYDRLSTDEAIAYIRYYQNIYDEAATDRVTELESKVAALDDGIRTALATVLASSYREEMITYINSEKIVAEADGYTSMSEERAKLITEESELKQQYYILRETDGTAAEDFEQLYLDLLDNRIAQATYMDGYSDYVDYCYQSVFYRDYSPSECEALYQWVKDYVCEAKVQINQLLHSDAYNRKAFLNLTLNQDDLVSRVQPYVSEISEEAAAIFQKMIDLNLLDMTASDTKASTGFTVTLNTYGVSFIFDSPYESPTDLDTLIHEFGHYYESIVNMRPAYYTFECFDICEIDSQGLEALMLNYADEIYGEDISDTAVLYTLYWLLDSIVDGCVIDEFEQRAYEERVAGTLTTPDQLTELFIEVENSYYGEEGGDIGEDWYWTPHPFDTPFYYISYASSAAAALSIWSIAEKDQSEAVSVYNQLVDMGTEGGFAETLEVLGIPNPFTEEGQNQISEVISDYLSK